MDELKKSIIENEGFSAKVYKDTLNNDTVGFGFLCSALTPDELALNNYQLEPMERESAERILDLKLKKLKAEVFKTFAWLKNQPDPVKDCVVEMCYQMGINSVKKFYTTMGFIKTYQYEKAYEYGLKSLWAKQTPKRAKRVLAKLLSAEQE